jgi:hypothetical protein
LHVQTDLEIDSPRRVAEPLQLARILGKLVQSLDVLLVEIDDFEVLFDPRGGNRLGQDCEARARYRLEINRCPVCGRDTRQIAADSPTIPLLLR